MKETRIVSTLHQISVGTTRSILSMQTALLVLPLWSVEILIAGDIGLSHLLLLFAFVNFQFVVYDWMVLRFIWISFYYLVHNLFFFVILKEVVRNSSKFVRAILIVSVLFVVLLLLLFRHPYRVYHNEFD